MLSEFKSLPLGDLADVVGGGTPPTNDPDNYNGEIPWITPKDLSNYQFRYIERGERNITKRGLEKSSAKVIPANSVLFTSRAPIGYVAISKNPLSTNQGFKSLVLKDGNDPEFFYYLLKFNTEKIESFATGSTFKEVSGGVLRSIEVSVPSYKTQRRIAGILGTLDDKIELNQRMNQTLEDIAKAIFKSWFVDFDPVRAKAEGRSTGLPAEISDLFPDAFEDSEIGEIPAGWKAQTIQDVAKVTSGKRPPEKESVQNERCQYVVYGGAGPMAFCSEPLRFTKPAIITGRVGTLGKVFYLTDECWVSDNSILICDAGIYSPLIFYTLQSIDFSALNVGSTQPLVTGKDIKNLDLIAPSDNLLRQYASIFNLIKNRQSIAMAEIDVLSELRDTLLPKLISGELRIPDAEKFLEEAGI